MRGFSDPYDVGSGELQGSDFGPVHLLIYANHTPQCTSRVYKAFAGDFKLYLYMSRGNEQAIMQAVLALQRDLNLVSIISRT